MKKITLEDRILELLSGGAAQPMEVMVLHRVLKAEGWPVPTLLGEFCEWLEERGFTLSGGRVTV